jgi:hypothetical protein
VGAGRRARARKDAGLIVAVDRNIAGVRFPPPSVSRLWGSFPNTGPSECARTSKHEPALDRPLGSVEGSSDCAAPPLAVGGLAIAACTCLLLFSGVASARQAAGDTISVSGIASGTSIQFTASGSSSTQLVFLPGSNDAYTNITSSGANCQILITNGFAVCSYPTPVTSAVVNITFNGVTPTTVGGQVGYADNSTGTFSAPVVAAPDGKMEPWEKGAHPGIACVAKTGTPCKPTISGHRMFVLEGLSAVRAHGTIKFRLEVFCGLGRNATEKKGELTLKFDADGRLDRKHSHLGPVSVS